MSCSVKVSNTSQTDNYRLFITEIVRRIYWLVRPNIKCYNWHMNSFNNDKGIAFGHFIVAGFVVPMAVAFIVGMTMASVFDESIVKAQWFIILADIIIPNVAMAIGVFASTRYINKRFVVADPSKIANSATLYLIITSVILDMDNIIAGQVPATEFIGTVIFIVLLYILSLKMLKRSEVASDY